MSQLGAFCASPLGAFIESPLHARGCAAVEPPPPFITCYQWKIPAHVELTFPATCNWKADFGVPIQTGDFGAHYGVRQWATSDPCSWPIDGSRIINTESFMCDANFMYWIIKRNLETVFAVRLSGFTFVGDVVTVATFSTFAWAAALEHIPPAPCNTNEPGSVIWGWSPNWGAWNQQFTRHGDGYFHFADVLPIAMPSLYGGGDLLIAIGVDDPAWEDPEGTYYHRPYYFGEGTLPGRVPCTCAQATTPSGDWNAWRRV